MSACACVAGPLLDVTSNEALEAAQEFLEAYRSQPIPQQSHERFIAVLRDFHVRKSTEGKLWDVVSGEVMCVLFSPLCRSGLVPVRSVTDVFVM